MDSDSANNYYKNIADHKDVNKLVMMLSSSVNSFRSEITLAQQQYPHFHFLWEDDREHVVKVREF